MLRPACCAVALSLAGAAPAASEETDRYTFSKLGDAVIDFGSDLYALAGDGLDRLVDPFSVDPDRVRVRVAPLVDHDPLLFEPQTSQERIAIGPASPFVQGAGPSVAVSYDLSDQTVISLSGFYTPRQAYSGTAAAGGSSLFGDAAVPLIASFGYTPSGSVLLSAHAGADIGGEIAPSFTTESRAGDPVLAPFFGLSAIINF